LTAITVINTVIAKIAATPNVHIFIKCTSFETFFFFIITPPLNITYSFYLNSFLNSSHFPQYLYIHLSNILIMSKKNKNIFENIMTIIGWAIIIFAVYAIGKLIGIW